jgi:hypothetical protein
VFSIDASIRKKAIRDCADRLLYSWLEREIRSERHLSRNGRQIGE